MARQVAHEIKNPLTPIQLSAEHLRRVHADRGEPLGQVLEEMRQRRSSARSGCCGRFPPSSPASPRHPPRARRRSTSENSCATSSIPTAPVWRGASRSSERSRRAAPPRVRRSHPHRAEPRQHRRECAARDARPGRLTIDASAEDAVRDASSRGQGHRHGRRSAGPSVRTLLLNQDDRHWPRPAHRTAQHRIEWRSGRRGERQRARDHGYRAAADRTLPIAERHSPSRCIIVLGRRRRVTSKLLLRFSLFSCKDSQSQRDSEGQ